MYPNTALQSNPFEAYKSVDRATMSGREIEAEVLTQAALKLKNCQTDWDNPDRNKKLDDALKYNQLIWSVFQGDLTMENNPLPRQLKQNLLTLSAFIDKRIFEAMAYPSPEKLNVIIDINSNIASGLRQSPNSEQ